MEQPNQCDPELLKTQNSPPEKSERAERNSFKRTSSNKDLRLRENYIIKRDNHYAELKNQIEAIASRPDFNRFISLKKNLIADNQNLLVSLSVSNQEEKEKKNNEPKNVSRKRLLHMKRVRPDHNSPLRERGVKQNSPAEGTQKKIRAKNPPPPLILPQDELDNAMMIQQMVTHMQEVKVKHKIAIQDPYSPKSKSKYYVAEVLKNFNNLDSLVRDHVFNSIYYLQLLSRYNNTSDFARDKPIKLVQKEQYRDKITVVFDLDETLVHCFEQISEPHQIELPVTFPGGFTMVAPLNIRPYAKQLLAELSKDFQIIIFTASHESYANTVIDYLDPNHEHVQHRLYRRHCDYIEEGYYVKDLRLLDREIERVVLVDNAAYSFCFQVNNGIPILPYYQGDKDFQLRALRDYLYRLREYPDVRTLNASTFKLSQYNRFNYVQQLVENLYVTK